MPVAMGKSSGDNLRRSAKLGVIVPVVDLAERFGVLASVLVSPNERVFGLRVQVVVLAAPSGGRAKETEGVVAKAVPLGSK